MEIDFGAEYLLKEGAEPEMQSAMKVSTVAVENFCGLDV